MNPSNYHLQQQAIPSHPYPANAHVNPNFIRQWGQQAQYVATTRANVVHVNPAFFQPQPLEVPSTNKIIINPKFFPQVQPERIVVETAPPIAHASSKPTLTAAATSKPSPIRPPAAANDRSKLGRLNFAQYPAKNRYRWKKADSPSKMASTTKQTLYKLVRKAPALKSPKLATLLTHRPRYSHSSKWLSPPKLTSTPIESTSKGLKSRFKLDNRKKKLVNRSVNKSLTKIPVKPHTPKSHHVRNKSWRPAALAKWYNQRVATKSNFTNFKSPLSRSPHVVLHRNGKLQRLVAAIKPAKVAKKPTTQKATKPSKAKARKRYYDETSSTREELHTTTLNDSDIEIAVKPSGSKQRTPLGTLPSFITL